MPIAAAARRTLLRPRGSEEGRRTAIRPETWPWRDGKERLACLSCHHIDDPLGHHDHLLGRLAIECPFYCIEGQNGSLNLGLCCISGDCDIAALLTVDLDRKCDHVLDQQIRLELRPRLGSDKGFMPERGPAFLRQ